MSAPSIEDRLRAMPTEELEAVRDELAARAEMFDAKTRMFLNDELRRRKLPVVGEGSARW